MIIVNDNESDKLEEIKERFQKVEQNLEHKKVKLFIEMLMKGKNNRKKKKNH